MERPDQIGQYHFGLCGRRFVKGPFAQVAVNHPLFAESPKVGIPRIFCFEGVIGEFPWIAVQYPPEVGFVRLTIHGLEVQRNPARTGVILQEVVGSRIAEQLGKETPAAHGIPVAAP